MMCDSVEVIKKVIKLAFQIFSLNIEKINKDGDLFEYNNYYKIYYNEEEQLYNAVSYSDIEKCQLSARVLYWIYQGKKELFDPSENDINELIQKIFKHFKFFKKGENEYLFLIDIVIIRFLTSKDDFLQLLSYNHQYFLENNNITEKYVHFLVIYTNHLVNKWKDNYQQIDEIIGYLFTALKDLLYNISISYLYSLDDPIKIEVALILREMFKYFPNHASNYFKSIANIVFFKTKIIIKADYIHFCVDDVTKKRKFIEKLCTMNIKRIDSLYALSIVAEPNSFDSESMCNLLKSFLIDSNKFDESKKRLTVFILLQVFTNYSSLFDLSDCFWNLFDSDSYLVPDYCLEYFVLSLFSFVTNFGDSIPNEKLDNVVAVIQKLNEMDLCDYLHEKMKFLLENCFTQNQ